MSSLLSKAYEDSEDSQEAWEEHLKEEERKKKFLISGAGLIAKERRRQIGEEGYDEQHDANEDYTTLSQAAMAYMDAALGANKTACLSYWPWRDCYFKPKDVERNLVLAGALIAAAIDRLHYYQKKNK